MHAFRDQFIQVQIARLERILPGVGASQSEKIFHDAREPLRLMVQHTERFAVFLGGPGLLRQRDFRFPAQNRHWRAQFMRGIGHEAALAVERFSQPVQ